MWGGERALTRSLRAGRRLVGEGGWHHRNQSGRPGKLVLSPKNRLQGENECVQRLLKSGRELGEAVQVGQAGQRPGPVRRADEGVAKEVSVGEGGCRGIIQWNGLGLYLRWGGRAVKCCVPWN